jgi:hypothetical protein
MTYLLGASNFTVGIGGLLLGMLFFLLAIVFVALFIIIISTWKMFTKAGEEGWKSIIPIYNTYIVIKLAFGEGKEWLISGVFLSMAGGYIDGSIGTLLTLAGAIISVYIAYNFMKRFADTGIAVASIFLPVIIYPIVGFSKKYQYTSPTIYVDSDEYTL